MDNRNLIIASMLLIVTACGCAAGRNELAGQPDSAGFLLGLWHGLILGITFVISLFTDSVSLYEVHNNGAWYNFGFLLGVSSPTFITKVTRYEAEKEE